MNNNGSVVIYGLCLGLVVMILALALAPIVQDLTDEARDDSTGMDCGNDSISNYDKAACVATDLTLFYFIGSLIFIAGLVVTAKIIFG